MIAAGEAADTTWYEPPKDEDGAYDLVQAARDLSVSVTEVGGYITDGAAICTELRAELPQHGSLLDLFLELFEIMAFVEAKWAYANDALLTIATLMKIEERRAGERQPG